MKFITLVAALMLLATGQASAALFGLDAQDLRTVQLIENGGCENGTSRWTESGSSVLDTVSSGANLAVGARSCSWDATAAAEVLDSSQVDVPVGLGNKQCVAHWSYKGADANVTAQVIDGTATVLAQQTLASVADWTPGTMVFSCPSSGTIGFRLIASADAAIVYFDQVFVGFAVLPTNISPVVYQSARSVGAVGSIANDQGLLADAAFPNTTDLQYYHLNGDGNGDVTAGAINLTDVGTPVYDGIGFDGTDAQYRTSSSATGNLLTSSNAAFEADGATAFAYGGWVNIYGDNGSLALISNTDGVSNRGYQIFCSSAGFIGAFIATDASTLVQIVSEVQCPTGWAHYAYTWNSTDDVAKLYLNGEVIGVNATITQMVSPTIFRLGGRQSTVIEVPDAVFRDVFVYKNTALTDDDIRALWSRRFSNHSQVAGGHVLTGDSFPFDDLSGDRVYYYNFSSTSTTADGSVNARDWTASGSPTFDAYGIDGLDNSAMSLNGVDQYLSQSTTAMVPWSSAPESFFIGAWAIIEDGGDSNNVLFNIRNSSTADTLLEMQIASDGTFRCSATTGPGTIISDALPDYQLLGQWHYFSFTYDQSEQRWDCQIDGDTVAVAYSDIIGATTMDEIGIGRRISPSERFFTGRMDELTIWRGNIPSRGDMQKLMAARVNTDRLVAAENQDWSKSVWRREDGKLSSQLQPTWFVDNTPGSVYLNHSLQAGDTIDLRLADTGATAYQVTPFTYDTGLLSSAPSFPVSHGLPGRPAWVTVLTEGQTAAGDWDMRLDLCSFDDTTIDCDLSGLTIDGTHRVQIQASMVAGQSAVQCATATVNGLVCTGAQTIAGAKTYTGDATYNDADVYISDDAGADPVVSLNIGPVSAPTQQWSILADNSDSDAFKIRNETGAADVMSAVPGGDVLFGTNIDMNSNNLNSVNALNATLIRSGSASGALAAGGNYILTTMAAGAIYFVWCADVNSGVATAGAAVCRADTTPSSQACLELTNNSISIDGIAGPDIRIVNDSGVAKTIRCAYIRGR